MEADYHFLTPKDAVVILNAIGDQEALPFEYGGEASEWLMTWDDIELLENYNEKDWV